MPDFKSGVDDERRVLQMPQIGYRMVDCTLKSPADALQGLKGL